MEASYYDDKLKTINNKVKYICEICTTKDSRMSMANHKVHDMAIYKNKVRIHAHNKHLITTHMQHVKPQ